MFSAVMHKSSGSIAEKWSPESPEDTSLVLDTLGKLDQMESPEPDFLTSWLTTVPYSTTAQYTECFERLNWEDILRRNENNSPNISAFGEENATEIHRTNEDTIHLQSFLPPISRTRQVDSGQFCVCSNLDKSLQTLPKQSYNSLVSYDPDMQSKCQESASHFRFKDAVCEFNGADNMSVYSSLSESKLPTGKFYSYVGHSPTSFVADVTDTKSLLPLLQMKASLPSHVSPHSPISFVSLPCWDNEMEQAPQIQMERSIVNQETEDAISWSNRQNLTSNFESREAFKEERKPNVKRKYHVEDRQTQFLPQKRLCMEGFTSCLQTNKDTTVMKESVLNASTGSWATDCLPSANVEYTRSMRSSWSSILQNRRKVILESHCHAMSPICAFCIRKV